MKKIIGLSFLLLAGCMSQPACMIPEKPLETFYTDVKGPSRVTGDCSGRAFWITTHRGKVIAADYAPFEGSCEISKMKIKAISHDFKTGKLKLKGPFYNGQTFIFDGIISKDEMKGKTGNSVTHKNKFVEMNYSLKPRVFVKTDYQAFRKKLP